jgi:hypothetical protein
MTDRVAHGDPGGAVGADAGENIEHGAGVIHGIGRQLTGDHRDVVEQIVRDQAGQPGDHEPSGQTRRVRRGGQLTSDLDPGSNRYERVPIAHLPVVAVLTVGTDKSRRVAAQERQPSL